MHIRWSYHACKGGHIMYFRGSYQGPYHVCWEGHIMYVIFSVFYNAV